MKLLSSVHLSEQQKSAITTYELLGGVLSFFLYQENTKLSVFENHRVAALQGLTQVCSFYDFGISEELLLGKKVDFVDFVGSFYDLKEKKLIVKGKSDSFLNDYFWFDEKEESKDTELRVRDFFQSSKSDGLSMSEAFIDPPYGLGGSRLEIGNSFNAIVSSLFDEFSMPDNIYEWSNNCSEYFESGKEWWGTSFYTYFVKNKSCIVVVLASATD